ncbi:MAG: hypothetical protein R3F35_04310 [Myxococcota bacterium]
MTMRIESRLARCGGRTTAVLVLTALAALSGCLGSAWKQTLAEDTPSAYYRFLREHGDSKHAAEAKERLDYHKLLASPSLAGFEEYRKKYPASGLLARLKPALEAPAFDLARALGTSESYRAFLSEFPDGAHAARAIGNATYLEARGFGSDPARLAEFARIHPASDFAAEAARTAETVAARRTSGSNRLGLHFEIDPATPEARRVRVKLEERIRELALRAGIALVMLPAGSKRGGPAMVLEVAHHEEAVAKVDEGARLARPGVLGQTRLVLRDAETGNAILERTFEIRLEDKAHVPGSSVLFSAAAPRYWAEFFVPFARWNNDRAVRPAMDLARPVVDVAAAGDRTIVLYEDGDLDVFDLADPQRPAKLARYDRGENYKKWSGVRVLGARVAIFGEEGLEIVRLDDGRPQREHSWTRGEIGRVLGIAPVGGELVVVGAKGMQVIDPAKGTIRRAMRRVLQGVGAAGDVLVLADGESVFVSNLSLLEEQRVIAQMKLGRTFGPSQVRIVGHTALVTGPGGTLVIDVSVGERPRVVGKLFARETGEVHDATEIDGRVYLVGQRGLLVLTPGFDGVEETVDVGVRRRVAAMRRHLVTADERGLQVVDGSPWSGHVAPAAVAP